MIRHICLFQFDDAIGEESISEIFAGFRKLLAAMPGGRIVTSGRNVSPEGLNRGFEHGFVMDFDTAADRDHYLAHPDHRKFASTIVVPALKAGLDSVAVFDYELSD